MRIKSITPDEQSIVPYPDETPASTPREKLNVFTDVPIQYCDEQDIGLWVPLTFEEYKEYFLHQSPGDFK